MIRSASMLATYLLVAAALVLALASVGTSSSASAAAPASAPFVSLAGVTAQGGNVGAVVAPLSGATGGGGNR
jgi:hypothetical protein